MMHFSLIFWIMSNNENVVNIELHVLIFGTIASLFNCKSEAETQELKTFGNRVECVIRYSGIILECYLSFLFWSLQPTHCRRRELLLYLATLDGARARARTHTRTHTNTNTHILGGLSLDEWSTRRRNLYLITHNTHKRHPSIHAPAGFEPAIPTSERLQTYALDRANTRVGRMLLLYIPSADVGVRVTLRTYIREVPCSILSGNVILTEVFMVTLIRQGKCQVSRLSYDHFF